MIKFIIQELFQKGFSSIIVYENNKLCNAFIVRFNLLNVDSDLNSITLRNNNIQFYLTDKDIIDYEFKNGIMKIYK